MTHTPTLKPCPFCGCDVELIEDWGNWRVRGKHLTGCFFHTRESSAFASIDRAVAAWNARTEAIEAGAVQGLVNAAKAVYDNHRGPKKQVTFHSGALLEQLAAALSQLAEASNAPAAQAKAERCECGHLAVGTYDGDSMCAECINYCRTRDLEEMEMPGGFT